MIVLRDLLSAAALATVLLTSPARAESLVLPVSGLQLTRPADAAWTAVKQAEDGQELDLVTLGTTPEVKLRVLVMAEKCPAIIGEDATRLPLARVEKPPYLPDGWHAEVLEGAQGDQSMAIACADTPKGAVYVALTSPAKLRDPAVLKAKSLLEALGLAAGFAPIVVASNEPPPNPILPLVQVGTRSLLLPGGPARWTSSEVTEGSIPWDSVTRNAPGRPLLRFGVSRLLPGLGCEAATTIVKSGPGWREIPPPAWIPSGFSKTTAERTTTDGTRMVLVCLDTPAGGAAMAVSYVAPLDELEATALLQAVVRHHWPEDAPVGGPYKERTVLRWTGLSLVLPPAPALWVPGEFENNRQMSNVLNGVTASFNGSLMFMSGVKTCANSLSLVAGSGKGRLADLPSWLPAGFHPEYYDGIKDGLGSLLCMETPRGPLQVLVLVEIADKNASLRDILATIVRSALVPGATPAPGPKAPEKKADPDRWRRNPEPEDEDKGLGGRLEIIGARLQKNGLTNDFVGLSYDGLTGGVDKSNCSYAFIMGFAGQLSYGLAGALLGDARVFVGTAAGTPSFGVQVALGVGANLVEPLRAEAFGVGLAGLYYLDLRLYGVGDSYGFELFLQQGARIFAIAENAELGSASRYGMRFLWPLRNGRQISLGARAETFGGASGLAAFGGITL